MKAKPSPSPSTPSQRDVTNIIEDEAEKESRKADETDDARDSESSSRPTSRPASSEKGGQQAGIPDPRLTPKGIEDQLAENIAANRNKRWWAFGVIGAIVVLFFALLMGALCKLFFGNHLAGIVGAANSGWQWHVLVFMGVGLVILAAIPLSLTLAVVRMISEGSADNSSDVKTPNVELAKALAEMFRTIAASFRG